MRQVARSAASPYFLSTKAGRLITGSPSRSDRAAADALALTNWTVALSRESTVTSGALGRGIGTLTDLRIAARGWSRRVTDLEIVGTNGRINCAGSHTLALGLREQLFVIERRYDETDESSALT